MAEQTVELQPGESKQVSFEAVPHEARTYQVSVDGLSGSFRTLPTLGFSFGAMSAMARPCPSTTAYLVAELRCIITNPHSVQVTRVIKLMWAQRNLTYSYWVCPKSEQDILGGCSQRYESLCPVTQCIANPVSLTLSPGESFEFFYSGYCRPPGYDWVIGQPPLWKHRMNYFWLEDDLGNRSNDGVCST